MPVPKEDDDDDDDNFVLVEEGDLALVPNAGKKKQSLSAKKKKFVKPVLAAKSFKVRDFVVVLLIEKNNYKVLMLKVFFRL